MWTGLDRRSGERCIRILFLCPLYLHHRKPTRPNQVITGSPEPNLHNPQEDTARPVLATHRKHLPTRATELRTILRCVRTYKRPRVRWRYDSLHFPTLLSCILHFLSLMLTCGRFYRKTTHWRPCPRGFSVESSWYVIAPGYD